MQLRVLRVWWPPLLIRGFSFLGLFVAMTAMTSGCIVDNTDDGPPPMCELDSDCDSGEVCGDDDGICYGNPPDIELAAILIPSGDSSSGRVPTEIAHLEISSDGTLFAFSDSTSESSPLQFVRPVRIEGKVTLVCSELTAAAQIPCGSDVPIAANIRVERASAFPGGPRFRMNISALATANAGETSFSFLLPPSTTDGTSPARPYKITITPEPTDPQTSVIGAAQLAPPLVIRGFKIANNSTVEWLVGIPDETRWVAGCLAGGAAVPAAFKNLPVVAMALEPDAAESKDMVVVSSQAKTDNLGCFSMRIPKEINTIDLRFKPDGNDSAPLINVRDETINGVPGQSGSCFPGSPEGAICLPPIRGPDLPSSASVTIPVAAQATEGGTEAVGGAAVVLRAELNVPKDITTPSRDGRVSATLLVRTTSNANADRPSELGQATMILPLNLNYQVTIIPATDSKFASRFDELRFIQSGGVQQPIQLSRRIATSGRLLSADGIPISRATITAVPAVAFKLSVNPELRTILDGHRIEATTDDDGFFFFWLEGQLDFGNESGTLSEEPLPYTLSIRPPFLAGPPTQLTGVTVAKGNTSLELGEILLPDGAFARGPITDVDDNPATGVELHIWIPSSDDPCVGLNVPKSSCPAAGTRIGSWLSDDHGDVRVVLPR